MGPQNEIPGSIVHYTPKQGEFFPAIIVSVAPDGDHKAILFVFDPAIPQPYLMWDVPWSHAEAGIWHSIRRWSSFPRPSP